MDQAEDVISDKIEVAVLKFKKKDFTACLSFYNEIVKELIEKSPKEITKARLHYNLTAKPLLGSLCHPKLVSVLDQRAATYEKLGNLPRALKDAQKAMVLDPIDPKGYLRAAKILSKQEKEVEAYKTLQKGLYTIEKAAEKHALPVSQSLLSTLRAKYKELNRKLKLKRQNSETESPAPEQSIKKAKSFSAAGLQRRLDEMLPLQRSDTVPILKASKGPYTSRLDPLHRLPADVIEQIFSYLPVRTLLSCHLVSSDWYSLLTSMPSLYCDIFSLRHRVTATEYYGGLRLMKKVAQYSHHKSVQSVKLWSTFGTVHLARILESLLSDGCVRLKSLDVVNSEFSLQLLLNKLEKIKWDLTNIENLERLRIVICRSITYPKLLLLLFPMLQELDIVVANEMLDSSFDSLTPSTSETFRSLLKTSEHLEGLDSLTSLSYISHSRYINRRPTAQPSLLGLRFPALTRLNLAAFNFKNATHEFGKFLSNCDHLESLYLEGNVELSIRSFLRLLQLYAPKFSLRKLTLREESESTHSSLNDVDIDSLPCLNHLQHLDIYGSSLSSRGLLKLLTIVNTGGQLSSLNVGKSRFVFFRRDQFISGQDILEFSQVFRIAPALRTLYLNEMDLDNLSMKLLHQDLASTCGYGNIVLQKLDISFCHKINGIGIMNLLNFSSSQPNNLKTLILEELILDGLDIHKNSIQLITSKGIVNRVQNDPLKTNWKQKGVNTLEPW